MPAVFTPREVERSVKQVAHVRQNLTWRSRAGRHGEIGKRCRGATQRLPRPVRKCRDRVAQKQPVGGHGEIIGVGVALRVSRES